MATRTIYTSTVTVPAYAAWNCEKCGEVNFSFGNIGCARSKSTTAFRYSKHEKVKCEVDDIVLADWKENACKIISNPKLYADDLYNDLALQNTNCTKCGKKPKWHRSMKYQILGIICFFPAIISGILAFSNGTNILNWFVFLCFLGGVVFALIEDRLYIRTMDSLSEEFVPVIGTLNYELIEYAKKKGVFIPTPDESVDIVIRKGHQM